MMAPTTDPGNRAALIAKLQQENPTAPPCPKDAELWTEAEVSLFFRSGGLLKPLISPWASGKKASPVPTVKSSQREELDVPEAVTAFINEPPRRRDDAYATPDEYMTEVEKTGHHERSAAAMLIPHEDSWLQELSTAGHLRPFEAHRIALAGEVESNNFSSWVCASDPALARGIDFRLFFDSLSRRVIGAVRFSPDAGVQNNTQSSAMPLAGLVATAAVQMALGEAAEEAVKLQKATVVTQREFAMSIARSPLAGETYRVSADVTGVTGDVVHATARLLNAGDGLEVVSAAIDFNILAHTQ